MPPNIPPSGGVSALQLWFLSRVPLTFPPCGGAGLSSPLSPTPEPPAGLPSGELQKDQDRVLPPGAPPDSGDGSQLCPCVCWLVVAVTLVDVHAAQMPQEAQVEGLGTSPCL